MAETIGADNKTVMQENTDAKCPQSTNPAKPFFGQRVLVVTQHFWPENFRINDIVEGFTQDGIAVDVLCGLPNYPQGEWFEGYKYTSPRRQQYAGAQVLRAGEIRRKGNTNLRIFLNYVSWPFYAIFNLPRLAGRKYDAVFCYNTSPVLMQIPAILYAKTHHVPLTTYVLDLWPDNLYPAFPVKSKFWRGVAQWASDWHYRRNNRLIAVTKSAEEHLRTVTAKCKRPPALATIPQYCEDFYAQDITDESLAEKFQGYFNILFAGNISPPQGLENLVDAMKLVRAQPTGKDVRVMILGDGMSRQALQDEIHRQGLDEAFLFCGQVKATDIPRWTHHADALYAGLAKSDENLRFTLPAKIASYLAAARPMLVAMDGEGAKVSDASGAALTSPTGNAEALAANILQLRQTDAQTLQQMGENGQRYYQAHYRRDALLRQLEQFILFGKN